MGKTSSAVKDRYNAKAYDEIKVRVSKGRKEEIKAHSEALGESVNGFINRAITEAIERDTAVTASQSK
jgi:predicted HicB family RNase H-like nuclease